MHLFKEIPKLVFVVPGTGVKVGRQWGVASDKIVLLVPVCLVVGDLVPLHVAYSRTHMKSPA